MNVKPKIEGNSRHLDPGSGRATVSVVRFLVGNTPGIARTADPAQFHRERAFVKPDFEFLLRSELAVDALLADESTGIGFEAVAASVSAQPEQSKGVRFGQHLKSVGRWKVLAKRTLRAW